MQVPAGGGIPVPVTTVSEKREEVAHVAPWFLPDGRHFLYLRASSDRDIGGIYVGALDVDPAAQDATRLVASEQAAVYAPAPGSKASGHLLFMQGHRLLSQPFDPGRLTLVGDPVVVAEAVGHYDAWGSFSVSRTRNRSLPRSAAWRTPGTRGCPRTDVGSRWRWRATSGCSIWEDVRRSSSRSTSWGRAPPLWTQDGSHVVYEGDGSLYAVSADGGSPPETVGPSGHFHAQAWSPNGDVLAIAISPDGARLVEFSPSSEAMPRVVFEMPAGDVTGAALSPDGRWLAYASDATGQQEIWMRPCAAPGAVRRVSPNGGTEPVWAGDGRTLYYLNGRTVMAVAVETSGQFQLPERLFDGVHRVFPQPPSYDVTRDGRFVMIRADEEPSVSVIVNWPEPLRFRGDAE